MSSVLTVAEVADELRISQSHVRRLMNEQGLPHIRLSERRFLIDRSDLADWLVSRRRIQNGRNDEHRQHD